MLAQPALALVNHLLASASWARDRLLGFAGKTARVQFGSGGSRTFSVRISDTGLLEGAEADSPATVSIAFPDDALARALNGSASLVSAATISGAADLAETLGFVFRNLRWDIEHDLSQLFGDVLARRGLQFAKQLARWQLLGARKLAQAVAEYLAEDDAAIARRRDVEIFCSQVDALRDDFARLEKRVERLERVEPARNAQGSPQAACCD